MTIVRTVSSRLSPTFNLSGPRSSCNWQLHFLDQYFSDGYTFRYNVRTYSYTFWTKYLGCITRGDVINAISYHVLNIQLTNLVASSDSSCSQRDHTYDRIHTEPQASLNFSQKTASFIEVLKCHERWLEIVSWNSSRYLQSRFEACHLSRHLNFFYITVLAVYCRPSGLQTIWYSFWV